MTSVDDAEQSVRTVPLWVISMIVASEGVTVAPFWTALTSVKVTVPKSAKGTRVQVVVVHSEKSSTIHSASYSQSEPSDTSVKVSDTVSPVVRFSMTALPEVLLVAVTVIVMESPTEMLMPEKSSGNAC